MRVQSSSVNSSDLQDSGTSTLCFASIGGVLQSSVWVARLPTCLMHKGPREAEADSKCRFVVCGVT